MANTSYTRQLYCISGVSVVFIHTFTAMTYLTDAISFCPRDPPGEDESRCVADFISLTSNVFRLTAAVANIQNFCTPRTTLTRTTSTTIPIGTTATTTSTTLLPFEDEPFNVERIIDLMRTSTSVRPTRIPERYVQTTGICIVNALQSAVLLAKLGLSLRTLAKSKDCYPPRRPGSKKSAVCLANMASFFSILSIMASYVGSMVNTCTNTVYRDAQCTVGIASVITAAGIVTRSSAAASFHCKDAAKTFYGFEDAF